MFNVQIYHHRHNFPFFHFYSATFPCTFALSLTSYIDIYVSRRINFHRSKVMSTFLLWKTYKYIYNIFNVFNGEYRNRYVSMKDIPYILYTCIICKQHTM